MKQQLACGRFRLPLGRRTLLMGILNVTPDSFSDGGRYLEPRRAAARARAMEREGADIIDIGAESTRPGAKPVSAREEIARLLPVIKALAPTLRVPISVDTSKAAVAEAALKAGASMVNDVTALRDPRMTEVVARWGVPVILMHMRGTPRTMQKNPRYRRLVPEIRLELKRSIARARKAGIPPGRILTDPGIGFGKSQEDNFTILKSIPQFKALGFPVVVGPSRKSFIGTALDGRPAEGRLFGTAAAVALAAAGGADIVRVHDVAAMRDVVRVMDMAAGRAG